MEKISKGIVKMRFVILIVSVILLFPSILGYIGTRVNYDIYPIYQPILKQ